MQRELSQLGIPVSDSLREFILRYGDWAFASPLNGVISILVISAAVVACVLLWFKVLLPLIRFVMFPLWGPLRRKRRISRMKRAIHDPTGMASVDVLNELSVYWGGEPRIDVEAATERDEFLEQGKDIPVSYPPRFYELRVPRGLAGDVKALMHSLGREEGWIFLPSRKRGKTELFTSNVGYRV